MPQHSQSLSTLSLSWADIDRDARILARQLRQLGPFIGLIAVTRGGLGPAAILSRELDIRLIDTLCIAAYDDRDLGQPKVLKSVTGDGAGWLVVDDLVDSGSTAQVIKQLMPKCHLATLYAKPKGQPLVDSFVSCFAQTTWISFPWDSDSLGS